MKVKLLKDLEIGRRNEVIDVTAKRATYLIRMGAALEWKQTAEVMDEVEEDKPKVVKKKKTVGRAAKKTAKK